jgi:hypothetical protein
MMALTIMTRLYGFLWMIICTMWAIVVTPKRTVKRYAAGRLGQNGGHIESGSEIAIEVRWNRHGS